MRDKLLNKDRLWVGRHTGNPLISLLYDPDDQIDVHPNCVRLSFVSVQGGRVTSSHVFSRDTARAFSKAEYNLEFAERVREIYKNAKTHN